jgi:outer membrane receptor protein involved in Fe transport
LHRRALAYLALILSAAPAAAAAAPAVLNEIVVSAARAPQPAEHAAATVRVLTAEELSRGPSATLDGALRAVPAFGLFRRADSLAANPTAQGVSLRGLGPSGASRSLVLLDGVPLNDPFGGWVAWTKLPRDGAWRAEIVPGGGATAWGNAALGGVVQILTAPEPFSPLQANAPTARLSASVGSFGTREAEFSTTAPTGAGEARLLGRAFATDGYSLVAPERRGAIDTPARSRHRWIGAGWRRAPGPDGLGVAVNARLFDETRGNGTPYTGNRSREQFASFALGGRPDTGFGWDGVAYAQDQSFASTFSSVNAARTVETPASDQHAVPASAFGAAWTGFWRGNAGTRTSAGGDLRLVRGETREHFTYSGGRFTRERIAGGSQSFAGFFLLREQALAKGWRAIAGLRGDRWRDWDGTRRETERDSGTVLRHDRFPAARGSALSPQAGFVWNPAAGWRLRANVQRAFRRPTLNELYRPFRQGANVTEANPLLRTERATSGEIGAEWNAALSPTAGTLAFSTVGFANDLRDAVANVTIARGPGTFPVIGALPAGGLGRQRLNVARIRVNGVELTAAWRPAPNLTLDAAVLFNDATVRSAPVARALEGRRLAQVPRRSATFSAAWRTPAGLLISARSRALGRQFEDDENQLVLGAVVVTDATVSMPAGRHTEVFLSVENAGDARIETGRGADGVINVAGPRAWRGGLRARW